MAYTQQKRKDSDFVNTYSSISFSNPQSKFNPSRLGVAYNSDMVKLTITKYLEDGTLDDKNAVNGFLVPIKAYMFSQELDKFIQAEKDPTIHSSGVFTDKTFITISDGTEFGSETKVPLLVIRRFNKETGAIEASAAYEFNLTRYSTIQNVIEKPGENVCDIGNKDFETYKFIEVNSLSMCLKQFYQASSKAYAYANHVEMNYNIRRIENAIGGICDTTGATNPFARSNKSGAYYRNTLAYSGEKAETTRVSSLNDIEM